MLLIKAKKQNEMKKPLTTCAFNRRLYKTINDYADGRTIEHWTHFDDQTPCNGMMCPDRRLEERRDKDEGLYVIPNEDGSMTLMPDRRVAFVQRRKKLITVEELARTI